MLSFEILMKLQIYLKCFLKVSVTTDVNNFNFRIPKARGKERFRHLSVPAPYRTTPTYCITYKVLWSIDYKYAIKCYRCGHNTFNSTTKDS